MVALRITLRRPSKSIPFEILRLHMFSEWGEKKITRARDLFSFLLKNREKTENRHHMAMQ
jgi:hypothetical protein